LDRKRKKKRKKRLLKNNLKKRLIKNPNNIQKQISPFLALKTQNFMGKIFKLS